MVDELVEVDSLGLTITNRKTDNPRKITWTTTR